jgi:hypothetical protein
MIHAYEIAALCAHHFGVSPRTLTLDPRRGLWSHADDATALAVFLIRRWTTASWGSIGVIFNLHGAGRHFAQRSWRDTDSRLRTDELLASALVSIETEILRVRGARALMTEAHAA